MLGPKPLHQCNSAVLFRISRTSLYSKTRWFEPYLCPAPPPPTLPPKKGFSCISTLDVSRADTKETRTAFLVKVSTFSKQCQVKYGAKTTNTTIGLPHAILQLHLYKLRQSCFHFIGLVALL